MRKNDLSVFKMEQEGFKITLKKGIDFQPVIAAPSPDRSRGPGRAGTCSEPGRRRRAEPEGTPATSRDHVADGRHVLRRAPRRNRAPFVTVGQEVTEDTVVCIIEAMKVMNEIKAEIARDDRRGRRGERQAGAVRPGALPASARGSSDHVQQSPHRQPRRNRAARHPRLQGTRHQDARRLFGGGCRFAPRAARRRGDLHRPGAERAVVSEDRPHHLRRGDRRRGCHPSRLRFPRGERAFRGRLRELQHQVHRAEPRRDPRDGRQEQRPRHRAQGRRARSTPGSDGLVETERRR